MIFAHVFPFADMLSWWWIPALAIILDAVAGDPPARPHPVRAIGALCNAVEPPARRLIPSEELSGAAAVLCVLGGTWFSLRLLFLFPLPVAVLLAVYLSFAGLAQGQLLREGKACLTLLERGDVEGARVAVGMLVSRDVSKADSPDLCRSLAETLAENFNDAFIAPLFWLVLGGPAALWLYKAASTMDSMWGYPHEPWARFGTAAARLDDALAWVPARLSVLFLYLAAKLPAAFPFFVPRADNAAVFSWPGLARMALDARKMKSPNAGWPMAACAWLHGASMGGPTVYAGTVVNKPHLGPEGKPWTVGSLRTLCRTIALAGILGSLLLFALGLLFHGFLARA